MKKILAIVLLIASGIGLIIPDPLPFIDEAVALMVFVNSLAFLGLDLRKLFGIKGKASKDDVVKKKSDDQTIDV